MILLSNANFLVAEVPLTDVDPPVTEQIGPYTDIKVVAPSNTAYGTRGLSQTASAEALGEGRLVFGLHGNWYQQQTTYANAPNDGANIFTAIGSIALGLNRHIDGFATFAGYGSTNYDSTNASGLGAVGGGLQGTLPFNPSIPIRMAAQVGILQGLSDNAINSNRADGYNYFETRTGLDFSAMLIQTLVYGSENLALKIHFNEKIVTSAEANTDPLMLLAVGTQFNLFATVFSIEANSRTLFNDIAITTDPLWITPSIQFRTAYSINTTIGADIALSQDRSGTTVRALEPYRLFAGMAFTFDTEKGKRELAKEKARQELIEKGRLRFDNKELAHSLIVQSKEDSIAQLKQKEKSDSLAAVMAEKTKQDSLRMTDKANQDSLRMSNKSLLDSIALADSQRKLAEEKAKRSEAEKQLLSTGNLLMDAVYFETNKTIISINSKPYLNIIAKMLTKYPKLQLEVAGHTDNVGSDGYNVTLSQGRSDAVVLYMIQVAPELKNMLTAKGYGESQPKADNQTADGRKHNRRTELQVINKDVLKEYDP